MFHQKSSGWIGSSRLSAATVQSATKTQAASVVGSQRDRGADGPAFAGFTSRRLGQAVAAGRMYDYLGGRGGWIHLSKYSFSVGAWLCARVVSLTRSRPRRLEDSPAGLEIEALRWRVAAEQISDLAPGRKNLLSSKNGHDLDGRNVRLEHRHPALQRRDGLRRSMAAPSRSHGQNAA